MGKCLLWHQSSLQLLCGQERDGKADGIASSPIIMKTNSKIREAWNVEYSSIESSNYKKKLNSE